MTSRNLFGSLLAATALLTMTACGSTPSASSTKPPASSTPSASAQAPLAGACRNLSFSAAASTSDNTPTTPCTSKHTSITVAVGSLVDKKHPTLTNVNSPAIQQRLIGTCTSDVKHYVGASNATYALSLVQAVWFLPTPTQIAAGARWYRCDMVVLAGTNKLAEVPGRMRQVLAPRRALNHWGTCSNAAPSSSKFRLQLCSLRHKWRAVAIIDLPRKSAYLSKAATASASKKCGTIAANNAAGALKYTWSFEWPNKQHWQAGQRYGLCWLPTKN